MQLFRYGGFLCGDFVVLNVDVPAPAADLTITKKEEYWQIPLFMR